MILSDISVKRPVFATVISALLVAFGLFALSQLPVRETPDIDAPVVSIDTRYPGASAEIVESKVTQVVEEEISGVEGIETIEATSRDGRSRITIVFRLERNIDAAANDVRDRVSRVLDRLPEEADPPEITKADSDTDPIMWFNIASSTMSPLELNDYIDRFVLDRLAAMPGVSTIRIGGEKRYAMRIWLDRKALALRNLTVTDIENALRRENVELPAGRIESAGRDLSVRTLRKYQTPQDFAALVIGRSEDGKLTRLADVAEVVLGTENEKLEFRGNAQASIGLGIIKQSQANTLEVARSVKREIDRLRPTLPEGVIVEVNTDYSVFIEAALLEVRRTLLITAGLVVLVIFFFVGEVRATLVPALTVPISLIASFIFLAIFDFSLNILTLLAMVLAIGLVVDDAIVVLENIYRRLRKGEPPLLAAYRGARQVGFAVIATTAVLIAVLLPISLVPGDVGRLFGEFALALAAAVFFSSVVALTLSPMLCSKLLKPQAKESWLTTQVERRIEALKNIYSRSLSWVMERKLIVGFLMVGSLCGTFALYQNIPDEFVPSEDRGSLFILMQAPEGASFAYTQERQREAEAEMMKLIGEDGPGRRVLAFAPRGSNGTGFTILNLKDYSQRDVSAAQVARDAFRTMMQYPGAQFRAFPRRGFAGGRSNEALQIVIGGSSYDQLADLRDVMIERLSTNENFYGFNFDYRETTPQIKVDIDRIRAADLGISVEEISRTLETLLGSRRVTTFVEDGEEYDVILQARTKDRQTPQDLQNIYVRSSTSAQLIPLSNLVSLEESATAAALPRFNRLRAVTISASLVPGYPFGDAVEYVEQVAAEILPDDAALDFKGEARDLADSSASLAFAFALSLLIVFLVLAAQFESFRHPIIIMLAVPFAVMCALFGLYISGQSLNIYSKIGIIVLVGLSAKNSILIVEFTNQLRDKGAEFQDAIMIASRERLRPILMTSLSTALGAVPLMMAFGAGAEARIAIGVVIFYGVLLSTIFTLYVVPVIYAVIARNTGSPDAVAAKVRDLDARYPRLVKRPDETSPAE